MLILVIWYDLRFSYYNQINNSQKGMKKLTISIGFSRLVPEATALDPRFREGQLERLRVYKLDFEINEIQ